MDPLHYLYPDLDLLLIGARPFSRELAGLAHVERIHHIGRCSEVTPYLNRAEVVWVPGRAGGVNAALEAMAAGKPVVAGRSPQMAEVIEDGVTGCLFKPGDMAELARYTRRLLDDPAQRRAMGEAGRQRIAGRFTLEQLLSQYIALFDAA